MIKYEFNFILMIIMTIIFQGFPKISEYFTLDIIFYQFLFFDFVTCLIVSEYGVYVDLPF